MPKDLLLRRRAERPPRGPRRPTTTTRSSTDSRGRNAMDPQESTDSPPERTGTRVRRHDEGTLQELAGGRS